MGQVGDFHAVDARGRLVLTLLPGLRTLIPRWRVRADDCLVLGASLAGSQKFYLAEPTVNYRVHGGNLFHRRESTRTGDYAHWLRREALKSVFASQLGIPRDIANHVETEFATLPCPTRHEYHEYVSYRLEPAGVAVGAMLEKAPEALPRHCPAAAGPTTAKGAVLLRPVCPLSARIGQLRGDRRNMNKSRLHLAFGCDQNVVDGLVTAIASAALRLRPDYFLAIHVIDCGFSAEMRARITSRSLAQKLPTVRIEFIPLTRCGPTLASILYPVAGTKPPSGGQRTSPCCST